MLKAVECFECHRPLILSGETEAERNQMFTDAGGSFDADGHRRCPTCNKTEE